MNTLRKDTKILIAAVWKKRQKNQVSFHLLSPESRIISQHKARSDAIQLCGKHINE